MTTSRPADLPQKLICSVCGGGPALRMVGTRGFCGSHTPEAFAAAEEQGRKSSTWRDRDFTYTPQKLIDI